MKLLFLVDAPNQSVGGHSVSFRDISNALLDQGHAVDVVTQKGSHLIQIVDPKVKTHLVQQWRKLSGYWIVGRLISKLIYHNRYDAVMSMNRIGAFHASIPCAKYKTPLIQIIPGGPARYIKFLFRSSRIISFSSEIRDALVKDLGWPSDDVIVCPARHDLKPLLPPDGYQYRPHSPLRIAWLSRLHEQKRRAFEHFLEQLSGLDSTYTGPVEVKIYGDGDDEKNWVDLVSKTNFSERIEIIFKGYHKVNGDFLREHDLVIAQGRGIIEAIVAGVPVAVCGESGYIGRVTRKNIDYLERTNFTGRSIACSLSTLNIDLIDIQNHLATQNEVSCLQKISHDRYDVTTLINVLLDEIQSKNVFSGWIPCSGSALQCVMQNILDILRIRNGPRAWSRIK